MGLPAGPRLSDAERDYLHHLAGAPPGPRARCGRASSLCKTFQHPLVGPVTVNCDVLDITDRDQRVVIYTAAPGSPSEEALRLLSVVGTQRMDVTR